ncbi:hypothetical protein FPY71_02670 [Aureimonas fodinaquatilis]|uniref:Uncharacterized protein n=1 Tax=Aureimonas fodinaquatilis TaxID=2565783 RepID=A0A5B0E3Q8_9HYPH|nr:hypothetical protein [Aureimonas fodinaquatilis]KAA0972039.1 hypothetical protein FPY71_02670 [Aureimonas fodinaquatilis]
MAEPKSELAVAKGSRRLADAVRAAKIAAAHRSDIVVDIREAERARLSALADEMTEVAQAVPVADDLFDFTLSEGPQPRYWVDGTAHISMARDRVTYRLMRETRLGRVTLAESTDSQRIVDAVTEYVAERIVERDRAMALSDRVATRGEGAQLFIAGPESAGEQAGAQGGWLAALWLVIGVLLGVGALLAFSVWRGLPLI